jgi:hypothetical protein
MMIDSRLDFASPQFPNHFDRSLDDGFDETASFLRGRLGGIAARPGP